MKAELRVQNVSTQVASPHIQVHDILGDFLNYRPKGYYFAPSYKMYKDTLGKRGWDGYNRRYHKPTDRRPFGKFWTGSLYRARQVLSDHNVECVIIDERIPPVIGTPIQLNWTGKEKLTYQYEAVEAVKRCSRGIVQAATGGGKTEIAGMLMAELNVPTIFIAHTIRLVNQAKERFEQMLNQPIGLIQAENMDLHKFNVATVQTLNERLWSAAHDELKGFVHNHCGMVMVDEAHRGRSKTYRRVLDHFWSAYYRPGFSATPKKGEPEDFDVEMLFGRTIYSAPRQKLEALGRIVKTHTFYL